MTLGEFIREQLLHILMQRFRGGHIFKAHSIVRLRVIKKKKK